MKDMQDNEPVNQPRKYLPLLAMLYVSIMLCTAVLSDDILKVGHTITMAGTLFIPVAFMLSDMIAEVYGYQIARQIIWYLFICQFIFALACELSLHMTHPAFWQGQSAYTVVLGDQIRIAISAFVAYVISGT